MVDTSIPLQNTPQVQFDPVGSMSKGINLRLLSMQPSVVEQQLASARASEEATRQATAASVQSTNEQQRMIEASKRLAEIGKRYTQIDPKTGKVNVNRQAWLHEALTQGVPFEQVGKLADTAYKQAENELTDDKSRQDFVQNQLFVADNIVRNFKDPAQAQQVIGQLGKRIADIIGPEKAAAELAARYGADPTQIITRANINAQSTISPVQAEQIKISKEQVAQGWGNLDVANKTLIQNALANLTDPASLDPNSPASKLMRDMLIASNPELKGKIDGMNLSKMSRIEGVQSSIGSIIVPAATRSEAALGAVGKQVEANFYDKLAAVSAKLAADTKYAQVTPANIINNKISGALLNDPTVREFATLVDEAKQKGFKVDENYGPTAINQFAKGQATLAREDSRTRDELARRPTFTSPSTPAAPAGKVLVIRKSDGRTGYLPADAAERAIASGQFTRGSK